MKKVDTLLKWIFDRIYGHYFYQSIKVNKLKFLASLWRELFSSNEGNINSTIEGILKVIHHLLIGIITLLSFAAGSAKVMHNPQEVQFLQSFAFNDFAISLYGVLQVLAALVLAGGALFNHRRAKLTGAAIVVIGFFISSGLIFASGALGFALASLLPVVLTLFIIKQAATFDNEMT